MNNRILGFVILALSVALLLIWSIFFYKNDHYSRVERDSNITDELVEVQEMVVLDDNRYIDDNSSKVNVEQNITNVTIISVGEQVMAINAAIARRDLEKEFKKELKKQEESTKKENKSKEVKKVPKKEIYDFTKSLINEKPKSKVEPKVAERSVSASQILMNKPKYKQITLKEMMKKVGVEAGDRVYVRIFKKEKVLELWMESRGVYHRVYTYPICAYSGKLGPKLKEGDKQSPEGFYSVPYNKLNPNSHFHLSFNLGYPNEYDRAHGRTGSYLMVHGKCASVGCYAMTDSKIEEIYGLVESALQQGQSRVDVHVFPFRMSNYNISKYKNSKWYGFWQNLKEGYDIFQKSHLPPQVAVENGKYVFYE